MRHLPGTVEVLLLVILMGLAWAQIEADRDNPPEPLQPRDSAALVQEAEQTYEAGDVAQASRLFWHAIRLDREQVEARIRLASIYQSGIHSWESDALKLVNEALQYKPTHTKARLLKAKILRNQGESNLAATEYLRVLQTDPHNAEAHYHLGTAYAGSQQQEEAEYHYQQAIAGDFDLVQPEFDDQPFGLLARLQLARLLRRQKNDIRAISVLDETLTLQRDYAEARSELADLLQRRASLLIRESAEPGTRLANYQRILEIDPEDPEAWLRVGEIYEHSMNQPTEAMEAYKRAYELDPLYTDALLSIRSLELQLEREAMTDE